MPVLGGSGRREDACHLGYIVRPNIKQPASQPADRPTDQNCPSWEQRTYHHIVKALTWRWKGFHLLVNVMQKALIPADDGHTLLTEGPRGVSYLGEHQDASLRDEKSKAQELNDQLRVNKWKKNTFNMDEIHLCTHSTRKPFLGGRAHSCELGRPPADEARRKDIFLSQRLPSKSIYPCSVLQSFWAFFSNSSFSLQ